MGEIVLISFCIGVNAVLAAYEMAFVAIPRSQLRALAKAGSSKAQNLLSLREKPERTLSIIQIGITLVGAVAAAVGGAGAAGSLEPILIADYGFSEASAEFVAVTGVVLPITYLSVVLGELVPKALALRNPARIVLAGAPILVTADRLLYPIVSLLEWSTQFILKVGFRKGKLAVEPETNAIEIGQFSPTHQKFMTNLAGIEKRVIRDVMLPWTQTVSIGLRASIEEVLRVVVESGHTRIPVLDGDKVSGILHSKEFIVLKEAGELNWQSILRRPLSVQALDSAIGTLRLLQDRHQHLAIVESSMGTPIGIVTLEDILEEIVGDIFDEDDDSRVRKIYASKIRSRVIPKER